MIAPSLASFLSLYVTLNMLLAVAFLSLKALRLLLNARSLLKLHAVALLFILGVSVTLPLLPKQPFFQPPVKIWSATSIRDFSHHERSAENGVLLIPAISSKSGIEARTISDTAIGLLGLAVLAGTILFLRDLRQLVRIHRKSHLVRQIGRVEIRVTDTVTVPFSYRGLKHALVIIPTSLLTKPRDYRIAIQHELQHHRQGDTSLLYAFWFLRLTCAANPAVHLWARELSEIQEFACDETLVDLKKVDSHAYARCLFEVAQTAKGAKQDLVCATGLAFHSHGQLLKRRINMMLLQKSPRTKRSMFYTTAAGLIGILALSAFTSKGLVQDRRLTKEMAMTLMTKAPGTADFPIVLNDRVLYHLNRYLGNPEGREFMRDALVRMQSERGPIEAAMKKYGVPHDLLAMPIIESGYENLSQDQSQSAAKGAGLWQFIPTTARKFGLRVDSKVDERLDKALLTDAAMRLLVANKMRFDDWTLSVAAYNAGEERVQEGIDKTGSRDAWTLIGKGFEGDHDYLAKLMAAILIMRNPESVQ